MLQLLQNEWMKIWKRAATHVMVVLLLLSVIAIGAITKYQENGLSVPDNENWRQGLEMENKEYQKQLDEGTVSPDLIEYTRSQIAINEYRLEHDITTNVDYSVWDFISDSSELISFAGLFTIIIAAGIVANEFAWGTVKLLLIRPIGRAKILLSKYLSVILFGVCLILVLFGFALLLGAILFGFPESSTPYLNYHDGKVTEQSMILHLLITYGLNSIDLLMITTMAFMISSVFRNSSLAVGISIFLMFMGGTVTYMLSTKFEWAKYILFANTDLTQYFEGTPLMEGMTLPFSIVMLCVYFLIFHLLAFFVFKKRDVAA
ncbi:ABC transporter permease [Bacillus sp. Au-Bac7]|uniref:ABC transporter permease n=1 Tax=Bacillus sp. Au-Bac7 TaxID=2906458 RepID=UPI001E29DC62|nr:ABC transporter permease [Bacillus sp. Au-Bac7]MCE4046928.1 ABC transporter permease [Bacillus sp. Au-Bac7]